MFKIICGNSNPILSNDICDLLDRTRIFTSTIKPISAETTIDTFSDGESRIEINENIRGKHIFVIQSLCYPVNQNLMELCLILDALKRSNIETVTVIIPYFGYGRQDRKVKSRVPISAKTVADILQVCGLDRLVTIDLHSGQIQGFFDIPVDNLYASSVLLDYIPRYNNLVIVSPDSGGVERANYYAKKLNCCLAFCYKHRENPNLISEMKLAGDVEGKHCILVDDMIDTAGTLCKASDLLKEKGANSVRAYATHGIFSGDAVQKIQDSEISKVFVTDTVPLPKEVLKNNNFYVISIAELITEAINRIYKKKSLSEMFA